MTFKSSTQPLCRYCGCGIKKRTHTVWFGQSSEKRDGWSTHLTAKPQSRAEAQKLLNEQIVSNSWSESTNYQTGAKTREYVWRATTWDGESWQDEFFCNADHARQFGYACVQTGMRMPAYIDALDAQKAAAANG